jgi:hypothetical protein
MTEPTPPEEALITELRWRAASCADLANGYRDGSEDRARLLGKRTAYDHAAELVLAMLSAAPTPPLGGD